MKLTCPCLWPFLLHLFCLFYLHNLSQHNQLMLHSLEMSFCKRSSLESKLLLIKTNFVSKRRKTWTSLSVMITAQWFENVPLFNVHMLKWTQIFMEKEKNLSITCNLYDNHYLLYALCINQFGDPGTIYPTEDFLKTTSLYRRIWKYCFSESCYKTQKLWSFLSTVQTIVRTMVSSRKIATTSYFWRGCMVHPRYTVPKIIWIFAL